MTLKILTGEDSAQEIGALHSHSAARFVHTASQQIRKNSEGSMKLPSPRFAMESAESAISKNQMSRLMT